MIKSHILGFPRFDSKRELKYSIEKYWETKNFIDEVKLRSLKNKIVLNNWLFQIENKLDYITVGDFSYYDHILNNIVYLGCIPNRFNFDNQNISLKEYFELAKGNLKEKPLEMTKWFNTNYHYLIPEYYINTKFKINLDFLIEDIKEAKTLNYPIKLVLIGPISFLKLGKIKDIKLKNRLLLLTDLILTYIRILNKLKEFNIDLIQIEEPILTLNLTKPWINIFKNVYSLITSYFSNILLVTYFGDIKENFNYIKDINFLGYHIDLINNNQYNYIMKIINKDKILSLGIIDGKNIWKNNLEKSYYLIKEIKNKIKNIWISSSCSLLHSPVDLNLELNINKKIINWFSFSKQKIKELNILKNIFNYNKIIEKDFLKNVYFIDNRKKSKLIFNNNLQEIIKNINKLDFEYRNNFKLRKIEQKKYFKLPVLPTTTIGSFPQTKNIKNVRLKFNKNLIEKEKYDQYIKNEIKFIIKKQLDYGIDVLVHGEPERNDMVEYFARLLYGFLVTEFGWVQSYGTRLVKPPIIYGDIFLKNPMTLYWINFSKNFTDNYIKGMLTGPITMLKWSFIRDDQPNYITSLQLSIAIRKEVLNLEKFNTKIIQIDEPALREYLPLKFENYNLYFNWVKKIFLLSYNKVKPDTQIHTHICYSEFENIIEFISDLDIDVISIETSRSNMEILPFLLNYKNEIGLGIYDIHNKNELSFEKSIYIIKLITNYIYKENIWINPDCGLKTRKWLDINNSLINMVKSAKLIRKVI